MWCRVPWKISLLGGGADLKDLFFFLGGGGGGVGRSANALAANKANVERFEKEI